MHLPGIDMDACHFWDPSFRDYQTNNVQRTSGDRLEFRQFKSSQHRKVGARARGWCRKRVSKSSVPSLCCARACTGRSVQCATSS